MNEKLIYKGKVVGSNAGEEILDWFYGNPVEEISTGRIFLIDLERLSENTLFSEIICEVIPETVSGSTGYKDKNGVNIFFGDIVLRDSDRGVVDIEENTKESYMVTSAWVETLAECSHELVVSGNVYDDPEILEEIRKEMAEEG